MCLLLSSLMITFVIMLICVLLAWYICRDKDVAIKHAICDKYGVERFSSFSVETTEKMCKSLAATRKLAESVKNTDKLV